MATVHTVAKGETLSEIAKKYNTTVTALQYTNSIKNPNKIYIGQNLTIPRSETVSKGYEEIGKQFQKALKDIRTLPNVQKLCEMLEE